LKRLGIDTVSFGKLNLGLTTCPQFVGKSIPLGIAPLCGALLRHRFLLFLNLDVVSILVAPLLAMVPGCTVTEDRSRVDMNGY
jgi:hypothetical protein